MIAKVIFFWGPKGHISCRNVKRATAMILEGYICNRLLILAVHEILAINSKLDFSAWSRFTKRHFEHFLATFSFAFWINELSQI